MARRPVPPSSRDGALPRERCPGNGTAATQFAAPAPRTPVGAGQAARRRIADHRYAIKQHLAWNLHRDALPPHAGAGLRCNKERGDQWVR